MTTQYFHFTLGPVQDFVAQARRTRDFWAGSFLLSWLAGVAMQATKAQGGKIIFPKGGDDFLRCLTGVETTHFPRQGSIPNRFKAEIDTDHFNPAQVIDSVNKAWETLAELIYQNDIANVHYKKLETTHIIWQRQVKSFWDMNWIITSKKEDSSALDQRKNWRSYCPPDEGGVKCMMMAGWQELSGVTTPNRSESNQFWGEVLKNGKIAIKTDLNENEALCAMAFIKRRFVHYFYQLNEEMAGDWKLKGWRLARDVPSVSYLAGVHWLESVILKANQGNKAVESLLDDFEDEVDKLSRNRGEWDTKIACIERLIIDKTSKHWASHDGDVFFIPALENKNNYDNTNQAQKVITALKTLNKEAEVETASPFYAVLMMDGDSLGSQMSDIQKQDKISNGLEKFTQKVPDIVKKNNGFLIYAGGDDVLALLPLEDALVCAHQLHDFYARCFDSTIKTSLSAAIEYAHIRMPLASVLKDAHHLLDEIAKEQTGRDALAIRVWKAGGQSLEWAQPWGVLVENQQLILEQLVVQFREKNKADHYFSSQFFYQIRDDFQNLDTSKNTILDHEMIESLVAINYMSSSEQKVSIDMAKEKTQLLIQLCQPYYRNQEGKIEKTENLTFNSNAALLVRFLAHKGVE